MQLNLTNGDAAASLLRRADIPGEILGWKDLLHDGPVPAGLDATVFRRRRAEFLGGTDHDMVEGAFAQLERRDEIVADYSSHGRVVLWFEHDLYDQLQILQILVHLHGAGLRPDEAGIICIDRHPEVPRFKGLGQLSPTAIRGLTRQERPVDAPMLQQALRAWRAFTADQPGGLTEFVACADSKALPFMSAALTRHCAQFPGIHSGLSRTESILLSRLAESDATRTELFRHQDEVESAPFLGDTAVFRYLEEMAREENPLLTPAPSAAGVDAEDRKLRISRFGRRVLAGEEDRVRTNGIDRWLGGTHLEGRRGIWRWNESTSELVRDT